jgi:hypothetical protein
VNEQAVSRSELRADAARTIAPLKITGVDARRLVWDAFQQHPEGVKRCAARARAFGRRTGTTGAGLLLVMIRHGEHQLQLDLSARLTTGWRWVRGVDGQSGTYVPDPEGTDPLPPGYDFVTRAPTYTSAGEIAVEREPIPATIVPQLRRLLGRAR